MVYETPRLVVRALADDDAAALYEMHRHDEVMRWLDRTLSTGVADELARLERWRAHERDGFGFFGIEVKETGALVGVQVLKPFDDLPYVDLGWRLHPAAWGYGYATESARGAIAYAFGTLGLTELAAATLPDNVRSRAVMERLGMTYAGEVVHAGLPHVLYLLRKAAGYSGTPLPAKLGIKPGSSVRLVAAPESFEDLLEPLPPGAAVRRRGPLRADVVVLFTTSRAELARRLPELGEAVFPAGSLWVAWPKRSSGVPTDLTEDVLREVALPLGLVDNKVCAVTDVWSGLRLVWRKERRTR